MDERATAQPDNGVLPRAEEQRAVRPREDPEGPQRREAEGGSPSQGAAHCELPTV